MDSIGAIISGIIIGIVGIVLYVLYGNSDLYYDSAFVFRWFGMGVIGSLLRSIIFGAVLSSIPAFLGAIVESVSDNTVTAVITTVISGLVLVGLYIMFLGVPINNMVVGIIGGIIGSGIGGILVLGGGLVFFEWLKKLSDTTITLKLVSEGSFTFCVN